MLNREKGMGISKSQAKFIKSLQIKKFRNEYNSFIIQGGKSVGELLKSNLAITHLYCTSRFIESQPKDISEGIQDVFEVDEKELAKISTYDSNNAALAVAKIPENTPLQAEKGELVIVLDDIRDPGNLGAILRVADWYGITKVVCSSETVDLYNPKVIAASMGSFLRVSTYYCELPTFLEKHRQSLCYGAYMDGEAVYKTQFSGGYLIMGNEANGVSSNLESFISKRIAIPRKGGAESLNVAVATGIICDNLLNPRR